MKVAIMQPYFFPYIGYFQLVTSVDKFIFYDDVNFIKNGWINRNRILINGKSSYFTVQLKNASSFKKINEIEFNDNRDKLKKTAQLTYKKAPYFNMVWSIIEDCLNLQTKFVSELAIYSIIKTCDYLDINTNFERSSEFYGETKDLEKVKRLIEICKLNMVTDYINPIGGQELYDKHDFRAQAIQLSFIKTWPIHYRQFNHEFIPWLSIIDVMMFNSPEKIKEMLNQYELV